MAVEFKSAFKSFIQSLDTKAQPLDAENPYKFQLSTIISTREVKEKFNRENATVYYKPKDGAYKELETSRNDGHSHKIPDENQFGEVWSTYALENAPNAIYDCVIDKDLILWVWTENGPNKVVSKSEPQV